jgi:hypothetical protein
MPIFVVFQFGPAESAGTARVVDVCSWFVQGSNFMTKWSHIIWGWGLA